MGDEGRKEDTALLVPLRWRKGHGTEGVHGSGFPGRGHAEPCILEWCCFCGEPGWMQFSKSKGLSKFKWRECGLYHLRRDCQSSYRNGKIGNLN